MARLVMKFGGTSVANIERIRNVAKHVQREVEAGYQVAVVVSAMSGKTNELVGWCREAAESVSNDPVYDQAEYDAVVASGEQVTSGLLALTLSKMGIKARSWQGWQIPIETSDAHASARITNVSSVALDAGFAKGEVAVISGFQGVSADSGRITTLGRGGSDTSAVAIAAAIALAAGVHEFWFHFGDLTIGPAEARGAVRAIENLSTGERHVLQWGGVRRRIDTAADPLVLLRCYR